MDIALLCLDPSTPLGSADGCSIQLRALAAALARAGHRLRAFSAGHGPGITATGGGIETVDLPSAQSDAVTATLASAGTDLVLEPLRARAAVGANAASRLGLPHVYLVDRPDESGRDRDDEVPDASFAASSGAIAFSSEAAHWVRSRAPRHYPIRVTSCGVDAALFEPPAAAARARAATILPEVTGMRVGFAGALNAGRDLEALVRAVARACATSALSLALIGDGPLRNRLIALAHEQKVTLTLTGTVPHGDVLALLGRCDVVVVPCGEPRGCDSPLKLIEAMAAGRALVASATRLARQHVRDGYDGLLVPVSDEGALAAALAQLARVPALRERLGATAFQSVRRRRRWDDVVGDILGFGLACAERRAV